MTGRKVILSVGFAVSLLSVNTHAQNLLTTNASFENGGASSYFNGPFNFNGWQGDNDSFNSVGVRNGGTDGSKYMFMGFGGWIRTKSANRANVTAGRLYRLQFDMNVTLNNRNYEGSVARIEFYNSSGSKLQSTKTVELLDDTSTHPFTTITLYAVAPSGATKAGVYYTSPFSSGTGSTNKFRKTGVDNFRLIEMTEEDKVAVRRASKLIEPGKTSQLRVKYGAKGNRDIAVRLLKGSSLVGSEKRVSVSKGRGVKTVNYAVPSGASAGTNYKWQIRLLNSGGSWGSPLNSKEVTGAFLDQSVSGSGSIPPNNSRIQYIGRWNNLGSSTAVTSFWGGSEIRARFNGTSIKARFRNTDNDQNRKFIAIIDGDDSDAARVGFTVNAGQDKTFTLATGLSNSVHTVKIYRQGGIGAPVQFKGFTLDSGKGLLVPAPPFRKFEAYGDSITEGGNAGLPKVSNPNPGDDNDYFGSNYDTFVSRTARAFGAHQMVTAKGGIGLTGSFTSGGPDMLGVWNLVNFTGFNSNTSGGAVLWDFSQYQPNVVILSIGHNDQFFTTSAWQSAYAQMINNIRGAYPNAHIFCTNTVMSNSHDFWQRAVQPVAAADPKVHYQYFMPNQNHGGHPKTNDHIAMATGGPGEVRTVREWGPGLIEWIEETMGWGIGFGTASGGGGGSSSSSSSSSSGGAW